MTSKQVLEQLETEEERDYFVNHLFTLTNYRNYLRVNNVTSNYQALLDFTKDIYSVILFERRESNNEQD